MCVAVHDCPCVTRLHVTEVLVTVKMYGMARCLQVTVYHCVIVAECETTCGSI